MDHFGVLPTLLGLCTFSEKLLTTLFELWITGLSWKQKLDKSTKTCLFAQLYLRPSGHWVKCLWSHSLVWSFWPWFLIVSFWWRWLLLTAQSLLCLLFTGSGRKYSLCGQFCWWHCWIEWRGREKKGVLWQSKGILLSTQFVTLIVKCSLRVWRCVPTAHLDQLPLTHVDHGGQPAHQKSTNFLNQVPNSSDYKIQGPTINSF